MPGFTIGGSGADEAPTNVGEFRRKHRWRFTVAGASLNQEDFVWLKTASRPNFKFDQAEVHHDQEVTYYAGKQTWDPIPLEFYDTVVPRNISQRIFGWLGTVVDLGTATVALPSGYKTDVILEMVDNEGGADERWTLFGAWPAEVNWQNLDYTTSEIQLVAVTLRYDRAIKTL